MNPQKVPSQSVSFETLAEEVGAIAAKCCKLQLQSLVSVLMIGSMGRGEATWRQGEDSWSVVGDAEFAVIIDDEAAEGPDAAELSLFIQSELAKNKIDCPVDVSIVRRDWLRHLPRTIFTYEIRHASRVVCGDPSVLGLIEDFDTSELELEDAWRLLCNRTVEWVEASADKGDCAYRAAKLALDSATSLLVFAGCYEPSYILRAQGLRRLVSKGNFDWPFEKVEFADLVSDCTEYKLGHAPMPDADRLATVPRFALTLADWEKGRFTPRHSLTNRLRGWAFVARAGGWLGGMRYWPRWILRAWLGTPRELVYSAALLFLAQNLAGNCSKQQLRVINSKLPIRLKTSSPEEAHLARQIGWNYRMFVEKSRA